MIEEVKKNIERVLELLREGSGQIVPEFKYGAHLDPDFFEWFSQLRKFCINDGKALLAKYRAMIHMCLLAHIGFVRGVASRVEKLIEEHGATRLEIIEALETAMVGGGGPTLVTGIAGLMSYEESKRGKGQ